MSWGTIKVRNACPFPVTFYALAGPTIELPANSTQKAKACLIWFSTRAKGGGDVINQADFDQYRDDYTNQLGDEGFGSADWEDGGTGAAAGSILGLAVDAIENIFMTKNTAQGNDLYFGAKKEGVYGNSDLVVYATLDPACRLFPQDPQRKWWYLHLEKDQGQETPPDNTEPLYARPDLSKYRDGMFFRLRNVASGELLSATDDAASLRVRTIDVPFNPLEYPDYWSLSPNGTDQVHNAKILNTFNKKWLTCYSSDENKIGLYPVGYTDYPDQHWNIVDWAQSPQIIKLQSSAINGYLVGSTENDSVFIYPGIDSADDQQWRPESFCVDVTDIPDSTKIRIMHAKEGKYITVMDEVTDSMRLCILNSYLGNSILRYFEQQSFVVKQAESGYYICNGEYYLRYNQENSRLEMDGYWNTPDLIWDFKTISTRSGFLIINRASSRYGSQLFYNGGFGLYGGDHDDQIWVAQLD